MMNTWWADLELESFWLEVTGRSDIGLNLKAPQVNENGNEFWSYTLLKHVMLGDTVFHYDRNRQAIVAKSTASTRWWEDTMVWAARGQGARAAGIEPHARPGWYVGLESFTLVEPALTLDEIRTAQAGLAAARTALEAKVGAPVYFQFEMGAMRPLRPMQGYLFKLPQFFVEMFSALATRDGRREGRDQPLPLGTEYRPANEDTSVAQMDPFCVDPTLVERGLRSHAETQNALASFLEQNGVDPRSPAPDEPNFDLAWRRHDGSYCVAEVKSLTVANEEKQLRIALGQLLRYRHPLRARGRVGAILAVERQPSDVSWVNLCQEVDILLTWPPEWHTQLVQ